MKKSFPIIGDGLSRRVFLGAGAAVITTGLIGLKPAFAQAATPVRGGTLKLGLDGASSTMVLDPATYASSLEIVLARSWGDFILESDPKTGAPVPALAESFEQSQGGSVWTFKIRKGVKFHNGSPLTAADVVATLKRHQKPETGSNAGAYLKAVSDMVVDGDNVVITLSEPNVDFPVTLTAYQLVVQPNGGADNPNAGIGSGPYKIVNNEPGVRILLERNADDWRSDRGFVDSVEIIGMNDVSARTAALASGQVHFINAISPKTIALLSRAPTVSILNTPSRGHYTMPMMVDKAPFTNVDLRLALKYAVDREAIVKNALGGYATVGNDFPINAAFDMFPETIEQRTYDPDKAQFHFKKSGHDGAVSLFAADVMAGGMDMAQIFQASAQKAGIKIDLQRVPTDGYWTNVWRSKPFCISYWGTRLTQDMIYSMQQLGGSSTNETNFANEKVDKLIRAARGEVDAAKRKEYYHDIAVIVRDEGGSIIPVFNNYLSAISKSVQGYVSDVGNDMSNGYIASRVWLTA